MMAAIIAVIVVILLIVWYVSIYNGFITTRNQVEESASQIDVQLQRRNDLIPNLVNTVKGYSKYEAGTLEKVTALRNQLAGMNMEDDPQKTMEVSNQLSGTLKSLFAVSEAYPDLKASAEYQKLMEELTNTENKIAYSRQLYNSCVRRFNEKLQALPSNLVGKIHHFTQFEYLQVPAEARETPKVEF